MKGYNGALITDIDGTVVRGCLEHKLAMLLMKHGLVPRERFEKVLHLERERRHRRIPDSVRNQAWVEVLNTDGLAGVSRADMTEVASELIERDGQEVYLFTRELITVCKEHGYLLVAISGSSEDAVAPFCEQFGFDVVVGSKYPHRDGVHVPGPGEFCAEHKDLVMRRVLEEHGLAKSENVIAIGDTESDFPMIDKAVYGIACNPNGELIDRMVKEHESRPRTVDYSMITIVRESKDAITVNRLWKCQFSNFHERSATLSSGLPWSIYYDLSERLGTHLKYH